MMIRTARASDAEQAAQLWTEAYTARGEGEGRFEPYAPADFLHSAARGEPFVAERDAEVLGIVVFHAPAAAGTAIAEPGEAELARLAVAERARGQGIGRALVERCLERAREEGAEAIVLWSRPYQRDAHRLYESLGFRRAPERDGADPDGRRVVLICDLGPE